MQCTHSTGGTTYSKPRFIHVIVTIAILHRQTDGQTLTLQCAQMIHHLQTTLWPYMIKAIADTHTLQP